MPFSVVFCLTYFSNVFFSIGFLSYSLNDSSEKSSNIGVLTSKAYKYSFVLYYSIKWSGINSTSLNPAFITAS